MWALLSAAGASPQQQIKEDPTLPVPHLSEFHSIEQSVYLVKVSILHRHIAWQRLCKDCASCADPDGARLNDAWCQVAWLLAWRSTDAMHLFATVLCSIAAQVAQAAK
jgi:hypothetical protein